MTTQSDSAEQSYVIVGGGLAGAKAAETLRAEGFDQRIVLLCEEAEVPYERPPLSKGYLLGNDPRESAYVHDAEWYREHDIELRTSTRVRRIDRFASEVVLTDAERVHYDRLLLATGSEPRRLDVPGADLQGVRYLRTLPDSDAIKQTIEAGGPIVVVGAGWIGLEVAAAARENGVEVTVLEVADLPLQQVLGDEVASVFADLHREHGVDLRLGTGIASIEGTDGRVSAVTTSDGSSVPAAAVVVGIGASPRTSLAEDAGLVVDNGVHVDPHLFSSDPVILAAGDIAAVEHPVLHQRIRVEHWANALATGPHAARSMMGQDVVFEELPYFFTDQYDLGMEYIGYTTPGTVDEVVLRGDVAGRAFYAFWLTSGRVAAAMHVNLWDDGIDPAKALILDGGRVDTAKLADPSVPLAETLVRAEG